MNVRSCTDSTKGGVLLLVMAILAILSAAVLSSLNQSAAMVEEAEGGVDNTKNQLMAESALNWAAKKLANDAAFAGTGAAPLALGANQIQIQASPTPGTEDGNPFMVSATSSSAEGKAKVTASMTVTSGVKSDAELALVLFGDEFETRDSTIIGDTLFADTPGSGLVWVPDGQGGGSFMPNTTTLSDYDFDNTVVVGNLFHYSSADYGIASEEYRISTPVQGPRWDLDQYLVPGPDRVIYWYENNLRNVSHEETAVFVLHQGHTLSLDNCHFPGGVIIYTDKNYDLRQGEINKVLIKHHTSIGGGTQGVHPHLGLIAPACDIQFTHTGCVLEEDENDIEGFMLWYSIHMIREARLRGQLIVYDEIEHFWENEVVYDPLVAASVPEGITFSLPVGSTSIDEVHEDFDL